VNSIVRCPRTGRACSEGACRERHWCRQLFERGLSHRGLPLKRCCAKTRAGVPCIMRALPAIVDDFTRECLALIADTSLPGLRVVRELDFLTAVRGCAAMCVSEKRHRAHQHGLRWSQERQVEWHYIAPGKPQQNAFIESSARLPVVGDVIGGGRTAHYPEAIILRHHCCACYSATKATGSLQC
jgi:transposase InsO family protein